MLIKSDVFVSRMASRTTAAAPAADDDDAATEMGQQSYLILCKREFFFIKKKEENSELSFLLHQIEAAVCVRAFCCDVLAWNPVNCISSFLN